MKAPAAGRILAFGHHEDGTPAHGYAATRGPRWRRSQRVGGENGQLGSPRNRTFCDGHHSGSRDVSNVGGLRRDESPAAHMPQSRRGL